MKRIYCNLDTCIGCKSCELACAIEHSKSKDLFLAIREEPLPRRRIQVQSSLSKGTRAPTAAIEYIPYPLQCRHCDEPLCVLACMSAAIHKDEETGTVTIDEERCVGCGMCIMVCPFGALVMDRERKVALRCDHCIESDEPACVKACPTKSLFFEELEEFEAKLEKKG